MPGSLREEDKDQQVADRQDDKGQVLEVVAVGDQKQENPNPKQQVAVSPDGDKGPLQVVPHNGRRHDRQDNDKIGHDR